MRIQDVHLSTGGDRVRLSARVVWEAVARPPDEAWFETDRAHAEGLVARPEAFLLPLAVLAMERGERQVVAEGTLCPSLVRGVRALLRTVRAWDRHLVPPTIDAAGGLRPLDRTPSAVAATTFAGGVDSLATIRANRIDLPRDHPHAVRDAFFVLGMNTNDFRGPRIDPARAAEFAARLARWRPLAEEAQVRIVPVASNVRTLALGFPAWARRTIGAFLAGLAHAFSGRVGRMLVPTSGSADPLQPDSCHPMVVPFCSSTAVDVVIDGQSMTRMDKLRLVADWPAALAILQPCQQHELHGDAPNCGRCNKCARTMVALEALGRLEVATTFPRRSVDRDFVRSMRMANDFDVHCHAESAALLRAAGRHDLAAAIEGRVASWRRHRRWRALRRRLLGRPSVPAERA